MKKAFSILALGVILMNNVSAQSLKDLKKQAEQKLLETPKSAQLAVKPAPSAIVPTYRIGRYVAPAQPPVTLSDEVIGWFD